MPPMPKLAPTTPPWALSPPWKVGKRKSKRRFVAGSLNENRSLRGRRPAGYEVSVASPGGLPRNSSCTFAEVSQLL